MRTTTTLFVLLSVIPAARGDEALRKELAAVALGIAEAVKSLGHESISVGEFNGPAQFATGSGALITKTLGDELSKNGLAVKASAAVEVKGGFDDVKDKQSGLLAARIKGAVADKTGKVLFTFSRGVFGENILASLFGTTSKLAPDLPPPERNAEIEKQLDAPKAFVKGSQVSAAADSPYAVEILAAPQSGAQYSPRAASVQNGLAFVPLQRGEVFGVKLINHSSLDAVVTLTIDGLNLYEFSDFKDPKTGRPKFSVVLVGAGQEVFLRGWHRTHETSEEFVITEYAKSASALVKSTAPTGVVTAQFAAAWPKDAPTPSDEPSGKARSADAVGRGVQFQQKFFEVERHIGVTRATVSVRYAK
jgi:hypothetical protein